MLSQHDSRSWLEKRLNVFLAEDDEDDALLVKYMLQDIKGDHFLLDWEADYESAKTKIIENDYDVCLIDYRLGRRDGVELLRELTEHNVKAPFILLTGQEDRSIDLAAMDAGASDYLIKGQIDAPLLERSMRYAIAQKSALENALAYNKQKEVFIATLTHDLKTPVRAEHRVFELFLEEQFGPLNDLQKDVIQKLIESNRFMYRIVDNLLTAYRYEELQIQLQPELIDFNRLIQDLVQREFKYLIQDKEHQVVLELEDSLPAISLDAFEIRRVLQNLIQNALTYTPFQGKIILTTRRQENTLVFSIEDNGPGIEPDILKNLFKPFSPTQRRFRGIGTGLGLYLSRQIVQAHSGAITVDTTYGKGTKFTCTLPMSAPLPLMSPVGSGIQPAQ